MPGNFISLKLIQILQIKILKILAIGIKDKILKNKKN